jgi:hypothetical protein
VLTCRRFADRKTRVEHRECLHRFSLLKAPTETTRMASSSSVGAFLSGYSFKINHFFNSARNEVAKNWFSRNSGAAF